MSISQEDEERIQGYLSDQSGMSLYNDWYRALDRWDDFAVEQYSSLPSIQDTRKLFEEWLQSCGVEIKTAMCHNYQRMRHKETAAAVMIALLADELGHLKLPIPVDTVATATILVAYHYVDSLCGPGVAVETSLPD